MQSLLETKLYCLIPIQFSFQTLTVARSLLKKTKCYQTIKLPFERYLMTYFGYEGSYCPSASLEALYFMQEAPYEWWIKMVPISFQTDHARAFLMPISQLSQLEAEQLIESVLPLLPESSSIHMVTPTQWYVNLLEDPQFHTCTTREMLGKDMRDYLPTLSKKIEWQRLMLEIQMVFQQSEVNRRREKDRMPVVEGLWVEGAGKLPENIPSVWTNIWSNHALSCGLAKHMRVPVQALPETLANWLPVSGMNLLVDDTWLQLNTIDLMDREGASVEKCVIEYLTSLISAVKKRQIDQVIFDFCQGEQYHMNAPRKRFWSLLW